MPVFGSDWFQIGRDAWRPASRAEIDKYIWTRMDSALALRLQQAFRLTRSGPTKLCRL